MAVISQIKATSDNIDYNIRDDYSIWSGRNLLQGTANPWIGAMNAPQWGIGSGGTGVGTIETITDSPIPNLTKTFRITNNPSGNRDWRQNVQDFVEQGASGSWQCSCWVRAIGASCKSFIRVWSTKAIFSKTTTVDTNWTYMSFPLTLSQDCTLAGLMFGVTGAGSIEYIGMKLERGNKSTYWSPAPEDIARYIGNETIELYSE